MTPPPAGVRDIEKPECFICGRSDDDICKSISDVQESGDARCRGALGLLRVRALTEPTS